MPAFAAIKSVDALLYSFFPKTSIAAFMTACCFSCDRDWNFSFIVSPFIYQSSDSLSSYKKTPAPTKEQKLNSKPPVKVSHTNICSCHNVKSFTDSFKLSVIIEQSHSCVNHFLSSFNTCSRN